MGLRAIEKRERCLLLWIKGEVFQKRHKATPPTRCRCGLNEEIEVKATWLNTSPVLPFCGLLWAAARKLPNRSHRELSYTPQNTPLWQQAIGKHKLYMWGRRSCVLPCAFGYISRAMHMPPLLCGRQTITLLLTVRASIWYLRVWTTIQASAGWGGYI